MLCCFPEHVAVISASESIIPLGDGGRRLPEGAALLLFAAPHAPHARIAELAAKPYGHDAR